MITLSVKIDVDGNVVSAVVPLESLRDDVVSATGKYMLHYVKDAAVLMMLEKEGEIRDVH